AAIAAAGGERTAAGRGRARRDRGAGWRLVDRGYRPGSAARRGLARPHCRRLANPGDPARVRRPRRALSRAHRTAGGGMNPILLIAGKDTGELLLSLRGLAWLLATTVVLSAFGLLLVGDTELSLLDNAQVVYD